MSSLVSETQGHPGSASKTSIAGVAPYSTMLAFNHLAFLSMISLFNIFFRGLRLQFVSPYLVS